MQMRMSACRLADSGWPPLLRLVNDAGHLFARTVWGAYPPAVPLRRETTSVSTQQIRTPGAPDSAAEQAALLVSVVIPCLNEAENIERCVLSAREALASLDG